MKNRYAKYIDIFKQTHILDKIVSVIFLLLIVIGILSGLISIYKYFIEEIDIIPVYNNTFVYDNAEILDDSTKQVVIDINNEFSHKMASNIVVVTLPTLNGSYLSRYAAKLLSSLESTLDKNQILILIAQLEGKITIKLSPHIHSMDENILAALIDREQSILSKQIGMGIEYIDASVSDATHALLYYLLPKNLQMPFEAFALSAEELKNTHTRNTILEMFIKIFIIGITLLLFVRFDSEQEHKE